MPNLLEHEEVLMLPCVLTNDRELFDSHCCCVPVFVRELEGFIARATILLQYFLHHLQFLFAALVVCHNLSRVWEQLTTI